MISHYANTGTRYNDWSCLAEVASVASERIREFGRCAQAMSNDVTLRSLFPKTQTGIRSKNLFRTDWFLKFHRKEIEVHTPIKYTVFVPVRYSSSSVNYRRCFSRSGYLPKKIRKIRKSK